MEESKHNPQKFLSLVLTSAPMKLIALTCDKRSFHTVNFNDTGLTLIVGDGSEDSSQEGSSNGVGKTLALGLVHHCLGATADPRLRKAVPDWVFTLHFSHADREHTISRTGDGKKVWLDEKASNLTALRAWLDQAGIFYLNPKVPTLSFRSLFKRFSRYRREDCISPLQTAKEQDFEARLRSFYLLGLDCSLVVSKRDHKLALDQLSQAQKNWQQDGILKDVFRAGAQPRVRAEFLERELTRLRADLEKFQVAEDYRSIELQAGALTQQLRDKERQIAVLEFQQRNIERSLTTHPDISREDLLSLYSGLQDVFKPEALAHFSAVEEFHQGLATSRKERFNRDLIRLTIELAKSESDRKILAEDRDAKLQSLQGKRALDEYAALAKQIAAFDEEKTRLTQYLNFSQNLSSKVQEIREAKLDEDRTASDYVLTNPVATADSTFISLAQLLYPHVPSGIVIENNLGENLVRYDLTVQIEGDDSDGINDARILCFDWLVLMTGANHNMDALWHDNRLFADIDPKVRAAWFSYVLKALPGTGKQYVMSINTENYNTMIAHLPQAEAEEIGRAITLTLRGDQPEHKLLGIQFGK